MNDLVAFGRLIQAIEPWSAHLVIVGGWAHRLYRFHPLATKPDYQPLLTRDTDLVFANKAPLGGDIRAALVKAGFKEEFTGDHRPPVTHYILGEDDAGFYAEFLTPLQGSGVMRTGEPDATVANAGITAQRLRYLDILLVSPWMISLGKEQGVPLSQPMGLQVANATTFITQKLLIHASRPPAKRAQDLLYIHDALELFGAALPELNALWVESVRPSLPNKTGGRVVRLSNELFSTVTETIRNAARIPADRDLAAERLRASCQLALSQVFF